MIFVVSVRAFFAAAAIAAAACTAGQPVMYSSTGRTPRGTLAYYDPSILNYAAKRGGMRVEIIGNPFPSRPKQEMEAVVTEILTRAHHGPRFPFFVEPPSDYSSPYRVMLVFDPGPGSGPYRLCEGAEASTGRRQGRVSVKAVLCSSERPITTVSGYVGGVTGPQEAGFVRLVEQVALLLLPIDNPQGDGGRDGDDFLDIH